MLVNQLLKQAAAILGFHVVRQSENPMHTLMGLKRFDIRTVLDIGANEGQFARSIRKHLPKAQIHCFEPIPAAFVALAEWAEGQRGILPVQLALGERSGKMEMYLHVDHSRSSSLLATTDHSMSIYPVTAHQKKVVVTMARLDEYVRSLTSPLNDDILVKLDVQGFEGPVLRGGVQLLARARACIIEVCLDELYVEQSTFKEVSSLVQDIGMRFAGNLSQVYGPDGHVIYLDAVFVRE
jgi:FkbM family methyltransferase